MDKKKEWTTQMWACWRNDYAKTWWNFMRNYSCSSMMPKARCSINFWVILLILLSTLLTTHNWTDTKYLEYLSEKVYHISAKLTNIFQLLPRPKPTILSLNSCSIVWMCGVHVSCQFCWWMIFQETMSFKFQPIRSLHYVRSYNQSEGFIIQGVLTL